jgi:hypothetical protein
VQWHTNEHSQSCIVRGYAPVAWESFSPCTRRTSPAGTVSRRSMSWKADDRIMRFAVTASSGPHLVMGTTHRLTPIAIRCRALARAVQGRATLRPPTKAGVSHGPCNLSSRRLRFSRFRSEQPSLGNVISPTTLETTNHH